MARSADQRPAFGSIETLRQWGEAHGQRLLFAANAGIYDHKFAPLGLYVENGKTLVPLNLAHGNPASGNFSLLPNGVFVVYPDGRAAVRTSADFKADGKRAQWATQSGPMLLIDGKLNEQFIDDSGQPEMAQRRLRENPDRSGVCGERGAGELPHVWTAVPRPAWLPRRAVSGRQHLAAVCRRARATPAHRRFMVKPYAGIFAVFAKP